MKDREDDVTTDRLLQRALHGDATSDATPECVDPETLAAWMDGSLSGDSLAGAEQHASSCARCQAMLASMARTAPSVDSRPWWQTLTARWLVPFAAAATALGLWIGVDRERDAPPAAVRPPQVERMEVPDPAAAPSQDPGAARDPVLIPNIGDDRLASRLEPRLPSAAEGPQPTPSQDRRTAAIKSEKRDAAVPDAQVLDRRAASTDRTAFMSTPAPAASASTPQGALGASGAPAGSPSTPTAPPAAPSTAAAPAALPPVAEASPPKPVAETVTITAESPGVASQRAAGGRAAQGPVEIVSPEPTFRWRLVPPATIQRSSDGGVTWTSPSNRAPGLSFLGGTQKTTAPTLTSLTLNAGSAPARDICWIVGSDGIVLLSADGVSWHRRPFTEPVNLTAVRATDAKAAVVTTEDGQQFSTADGGATWSKIP